MKFLLILVLVTFANSIEALELPAYQDFPFGIICDHFQLYYDYLEGLEESEYELLHYDYPDQNDDTDKEMLEEYESEDSYYPDQDDDVVKCVIARNGKTLFNETFLWKDRYSNGVFAIADKSWNGTGISVDVSWGNKSQLFELTVQVYDSFDDEIKHEKIDIGEEITLACFENTVNWIISKNQFESIETVWFYGNNVIRRDDQDFEYEKAEFLVNEDGEFSFDSLKIRKASLSRTPGQYHCVLEHKNKQSTVKSYQVCLQKPFKPNSPTIVASKMKYKATSGSSINVTCAGHTGSASSSASQYVKWSKYGEKTKCVDALSSDSTKENCSSKIHRNIQYCEPVANDEIADVKNHRVDDNFTATFTMSALTEADSGLYTCMLQTTQDTVRSDFTIIVEESLEDKSNTLTVALAVVGGFIFVAILLIVLFHIYMTPILYFLKHYFAPYESMDRKYLAYMVYSADVFFDMKNNMLQDTDRYFKRLNIPVYDPNNNAEHAGAPIATNVTETLRRCMAVVLFVTPQLLDNHGNGDNEIYEVYQALENNVENLNMRVVFICLEETKKRIIMQAGKGNEFCVMLRRFMGRQGNTVILWKSNNQRAFHRALYVALPKLKTQSSTPLMSDHSAV